MQNQNIPNQNQNIPTQNIPTDVSFHEIRFPTEIALGAQGGPERRTDVIVLASGHEKRNARWTHSRRKYNAGYGIKSLRDLYKVIEFFEARNGRLYGFRWKDPIDHSSANPGKNTTPTDQIIARGDGETTQFQLIKTYQSGTQTYQKPIIKPVKGTVTVLSNQKNITLTGDNAKAQIDETTGIITFKPQYIPKEGEIISAGFEFDIPVRFDTDILNITLSHFNAGNIPDIPIVEIRL